MEIIMHKMINTLILGLMLLGFSTVFEFIEDSDSPITTSLVIVLSACIILYKLTKHMNGKIGILIKKVIYCFIISVIITIVFYAFEFISNLDSPVTTLALLALISYIIFTIIKKYKAYKDNKFL